MEDCVASHEVNELAVKIKRNINKLFWDEEKGVYFDEVNIVGYEKLVFSDSNCYAVVFGIVEEANIKRILNYLKENMWCEYGSKTIDCKIEKAILKSRCRNLECYFGDIKNNDITEIIWPHNAQIWPFMNAYEVEANFIAGNTTEAFELIYKCWGNMVNKEPGTFWEMVEATTGDFTSKSLLIGSKYDVMNSACHGWSGWISYLMQAYILGIKPEKPGFIEFSISPNVGDLKKIKGNYPTPKGIIRVEILNNKDKFELVIEKPENMKIIYRIYEDKIGNKEIVIKENGQVVKEWM